MKKYIFVSLAALFITCLTAGAQSTSFETLRTDRDAATASMAGSAIASTDHVAFAAFKNAAAVPFYDGKFDAQVSYLNSSPKSSAGADVAAGAGFKLGERFAMAVAFDYRAGSEYDVIDDFGTPRGKFKTSTVFAGAGFGFRITDGLSIGANLKLATQKLSEEGGPKAFAGDLFVLYKAKSGLSATAGVSSVGGGAKDVNGNSYSTPASATAGIAYLLGDKAASSVELCGDLDYFFTGGLSAAAGAQYSFKDIVSVRAGYHYGSDKAPVPSYLAVGAGVKYSGVHLDFAYHLANEVLGGTFNVGIGFAF